MANGWATAAPTYIPKPTPPTQASVASQMYGGPVPGLTPQSFSPVGFRDTNAQDFLMRALGMSAPETARPATPLDTFGNSNFGGLFAQLMQKLTGTGVGMGTPAPAQGLGMWPGSTNVGNKGLQPGPVANPLGALNQFAGPFGNGGGYLQPRMTTQPVTIRAPNTMY